MMSIKQERIAWWWMAVRSLSGSDANALIRGSRPYNMRGVSTRHQQKMEWIRPRTGNDQPGDTLNQRRRQCAYYSCLGANSAMPLTSVSALPAHCNSLCHCAAIAHKVEVQSTQRSRIPLNPRIHDVTHRPKNLTRSQSPATKARFRSEKSVLR